MVFILLNFQWGFYRSELGPDGLTLLIILLKFDHEAEVAWCIEISSHVQM